MNSNNNFNPQIYNEQLSPFGRKVFKVLLQQWRSNNETRRQPLVTENRNQSRNSHRHCSKDDTSYQNNKKTLNFLDHEQVITTSELLSSPNTNDTNMCYIRNNELFDVPKSTQLIASTDGEKKFAQKVTNDFTQDIPSNQEHAKLITSINDIKENPTPRFNTERSLSLEFHGLFNEKIEHDASNQNNNDSIDNNSHINYLFEDKICQNDAASNKKQDDVEDNIIWNDIIDTQLLVSNVVSTERERPFELPTISNENVVIMRATDDSKIRTDNVLHEKQFKKQTETDGSRKPCKRKNAKITESISNKVKIPKKAEKSSSKTILRKQKYTTTVQNWLEDVETNKENLDDIYGITANDLNTKQTGFEEHKNNQNKGKHLKKVVQAQLTNKGGVMKFDKPKISNQDVTVSKPLLQDPETKTVKEKKSKPKFSVPIKSQVPVKDIVYDIYNIDCKSVITRSIDLRMRNSEIFMVLTYSNGFNQLNSQFTEHVCLPEAMMLLINDKFFYLIGKDFNVIEDIAALVKYNTVVCYGGKSVIKYLNQTFEIDVHEVNALDTKIGGGLMDPDNPPENFTNLQRLLGLTVQYTIATECPLQKAAWYLTLLRDAMPRLTALLKENSLWKVFMEIEMAVMPIIASMEIRGITVDSEKLNSMEVTLLSRMKATEQECYKAAGKKFQINSTVQVRAILYDELQLDTKSNVKIKETVCQGAKSTSETMLRSLTAVHPLPKLILDYRQLHKAHATFLVGIAQHIKNGVVRPTWEQTAAATGRIAANNPNIQAIPKAEIDLNNVSDEVNQSDKVSASESHQLNFRSIYIARPGFVLLAADFNHVECRVFAHAAADSSLLELLSVDKDLFRVLAAKWLNKPEDLVTSEDRERTKRIIYASLYGAGARKLTDILGVSYDQALTVFSSFNRTFPSLKSFGRSVVAQCSRDGGTLSTLCGRVRRFANIDSDDAALKAQAERQAVNFVVQGSAADLCKLAMVQTVQQLRKAGLEAHLLLQIHDELVWEIREEQLLSAAGIIKCTMESCGSAVGAGGTLPVTLHAGRSWGHMPTLTL